MAIDQELDAHREWIGYLQPVGLVVSPPALASAQAFPDRAILPLHNRFRELVEPAPIPGKDDPAPAISDWPRVFIDIFGWEPADLLGHGDSGPVPEALEVHLPDYGETLRPTYAVPEFADGAEGGRRWLMLIEALPVGTALDGAAAVDGHGWEASPQARFERLLRETQVPIGLLANGTHLRLVYAPRGETSGHVTFPVAAMAEVPGRPIFAALHMLLSAERLFSLPDRQRLPAILAESRKYQNLVSTKLAQQVLAALYELQRGFQAADDQRGGDLLRAVLTEDPNQVYGGLLTTLLRLVFLLYAEDRGLLSGEAIYVNHYSVGGLFERLRADAGRYPDTMDHRFGSWPQLLALFRLIHDGGGHGGFRIPARRGYLFDPERYPFLEGRTRRRSEEKINPPLVPDGVIYRVLERLLILDGERLSYRTLDVEQIGSVYETMMGFRVEIARGASIAVKAKKPHGAPTAVDLDALLAVEPKERAKTLKALTDQELTGDALKAAKSVEDVVAALGRKVAAEATPRIVPPGAIVLQPSDERRRSGSHYTPRALTGPIVRTTLRPILEGLGPRPTPGQILDLAVCDPAMGSGAFLVEVCRQLGEALVDAWHAHDYVHNPPIPPDEDEVLHARRLVAQRCLYGVDRNPMAVDLAKLSLWLATLAKDHPFTFLDHALRPGDSLLGVTLNQIASFSLNAKGKTESLFQRIIRNKVQILLDHRRRLFAVKDDEPEAYDIKRRLLGHIEGQSNDLNYAAARLIELAWNPPPKREAEARRTEAVLDVDGWLRTSDDDRDERLARELEATRRRIWPDPEKRIAPFHWEIEFPEVFGGDALGFDAIVGNPPFAGKNTMAEGNAAGYPDWLKQVHEGSHGNADLVAHFFRRAFDLLRPGGAFGLIATNTIGQGDTRGTGLRHICTHGGTIYAARKRLKWPGLAAVVVSVVHARKGPMPGPFDLDGRKVPIITAYLFHAGGHEDPARLLANANKSFQGSIVLGMGFTFDDTDTKGVASPISEMHRLIAKDPRNAERIFPYIGGEEINNSPTHTHHRYVINFGEMTEEEARRWPDLMAIVEEKGKPQREQDNREIRRRNWWRFGESTPALSQAISKLASAIVCPPISSKSPIRTSQAIP